MDALMAFIKDRVTESYKWTQTEFAEKCGVTEAAMSRYFKGQRRPRIETYEKMLDVLGYELVLQPKDLIIID